LSGERQSRHTIYQCVYVCVRVCVSFIYRHENTTTCIYIYAYTHTYTVPRPPWNGAVTEVTVGTCLKKKIEKKKVPRRPWYGAVKGVKVGADGCGTGAGETHKPVVVAPRRQRRLKQIKIWKVSALVYLLNRSRWTEDSPDQKKIWKISARSMFTEESS
jgi:hypothetical protein